MISRTFQHRLTGRDEGVEIGKDISNTIIQQVDAPERFIQLVIICR